MNNMICKQAILFMHSSVEGHFGCFHFRLILNSVAKYKFLCQCVFSFRNTRNISIPGIELLDQITPHFTFWFYITTTNVWTFQILHILIFYRYLSFILITLVECEAVPRCSINLHFPSEEWCWASFHVLINLFFGEMSIQISHPFLIQLLLFLLLSG